MTEPQQIEKKPIVEACTTMSALLEKHMTRAFRRREPTDREIEKNAVHRGIVRDFHGWILSTSRDAIPAAALAERIVALPRYPGAVLLEKVLSATEPEQRVSLAACLVALPPAEEPRWWPIARSLSALGEMTTASARSLLIRCVMEQVAVSQATMELMTTLGFPIVGEARQAMGELSTAFSQEGARRFLDLLGIDPDTHTIDLERARAFHGKVYDNLNEALASPEDVVAVDLHGLEHRSIPDELQRCPGLRYLIIDDDYIRDSDMRRLEALLPGVEIQWSMSMHVDGKHGR